ncbi:MAG: hypothetical protein A4E53_03854 [Pelotomaculum sp. PtaB.Bin104]|nr:MAG: hypothetical protein A4E53_03854 [Pelotomaculum sp. PtaB.Bin104]
MDWGDIFTGLTAVAAFLTACANFQQNNVQLSPILSYTKKEDSEENLSGYLKFRNVGRGAGTLLAVDVFPEDIGIKCHIATPLSIGSESEATIQIWLPKENYTYRTTITLYYWDIADNCHATKVEFEIEYQTPDANPRIQKPWLEVREPMERIKKFCYLQCCPERPSKLQHWDPKHRREYINKYSKKY